MLRKILTTSLILGTIIVATGCNKKKDSPPLFFLLMGGGESVAATPETLSNAASGQGFVVTPLDENSGNSTPAIPVASSTTAPADDGVFTNPTGPTEVTSQIRYDVVPGSFIWDNTISTNVTLRVTNEDGPINNILVKITEDRSTPGTEKFLSQGFTVATGLVTVRITVTPNVNEVIVRIIGINPKTGLAQEIVGRIAIQLPANPGGGNTGGGGNNGGGNNGGGDNGTVVVAPSIVLDTKNFSGIAGCLPVLDADCDGVLDADDKAPTNALVGWVEESGRFTMAWEDLYDWNKIRAQPPTNTGNDMDLNDHVTVFQTKIGYAPDGKVREVEGIFTMTARGAGYVHDLRVAFDVPSNVTGAFTVSYLNGHGNTFQVNCELALTSYTNAGDCTGGTLNADQLRKGALIFPNSRNMFLSTSGQQNAPVLNAALNFTRGTTSRWKIVFSAPVDFTAGRNVMGGHFNYLLPIRNTSQIVYRPGFYFEGTGATAYDRYVDRVSGFPFAVIVPGVFNYPRGGVNIMGTNSGYQHFKTWAESKGVSYRNWFQEETRPSSNVPIRTHYIDAVTGQPLLPFTAVLVESLHWNVWIVSVMFIFIGAILGFYFRDKLLLLLNISRNS